MLKLFSIILKLQNLPQIFLKNGADLTKKGADLTTIGVKKGADLTKNGADLTTFH